MSSPLPDLLDPWRAVGNRAVFTGRLELSRLPRLGEILLDTTGEVAFRLEFLRDEGRRPVVLGEAKAELHLCCQRCLREMKYPVDARIALALVTGIDEATRLPERYDPLLVSGGMIRPFELIEDELLLALPQIPAHRAGACSTAAGRSVAAAAVQADSGAVARALADWKDRQEG